ncbi:hypothetical protein JOB18_005116 [Solea senegalensis]|nr:nuclear GTPase SLIP-GC-like isoform X1 [Solea senegalensis]XP_043872792.1 nuclear GTPase SLIP-GC-like isoform X1 [Solea senegalensis]XP_043872793.1 nuclear GTPase SLIP-GC-like isoform X1 [Solea senegalensis]KAG7466693.1 hypothetical protein JOB18_005116 [Solea senegalensis]
MDTFVKNKLHEWGLSKWIPYFQVEEINEQSFHLLDDRLIDQLIPKGGPRMIFKDKYKLWKETQHPSSNREMVAAPSPVGRWHRPRHLHIATQTPPSTQKMLYSPPPVPSTSGRIDTGKRLLDPKEETPRKRQCVISPDSHSEDIILGYVKDTIALVSKTLQNKDNTRLNAFLKDKIKDLKTEKRELVGVFGKTGAGKSSLINAVIEEKELLPSGDVDACTSVMIKLEANMDTPRYEAHIEFITPEEWKDELWSMENILDEHDDDYSATEDKISALYEQDWKEISNGMDNKYFKEIPEFLQSRKKIIKCDSVKELAAKCVKYTRNNKKVERSKLKRQYWPLVKCVTLRVPGNDLLQHVTIVDLPGTGDRNKSRDKMWKEIVGNCSTVWIVTETTRATAEKESWEILENASRLMGNGGECQHIHFICTKSDQINDSDCMSRDEVRNRVLERNKKAKHGVMKQFSKENKIKKHFSDDSFKVFTVSSKEFLKNKYLERDETEIPRLQNFLKDLNDSYSETLNYVSGACGILSLIQGTRCMEVAGKKAEVYKDIEEKMSDELDKVKKSVEEAHSAFESHLAEGVEKSLRLCDKTMKSILEPPRTLGSSFHMILKYVVQNSGAYKSKKGKPKNLNEKLSSHLTDSIDAEFKKTFPNESNSGPFKNVIKEFSLNTETLIQKYDDVKLQLTFLKTEEDKLKLQLHKIIRDRKKKIYSSLTDTIEANMKTCYDEAKEIRGPGSLLKMREIIRTHVCGTKYTMFEMAKKNMLTQLDALKDEILKKLEETLMESIELALKTGSDSFPDVSENLNIVTNFYTYLKGRPEERPGPSN